MDHQLAAAPAFHSLVLDDALPDFARARAWADSAAYADIVNPADGVTYPGICADVPYWIQREIGLLAERAVGRQVKFHYLFARLSPAGTAAPHQAHNDESMGRYSLMLYLNRPEHCQGGTSLVKHVSGAMERGAETPAQFAVWEAEHSQPDRWHAYSTCEMRTNRAFIFDGTLMHRSEPVGGFGSTPVDGRLVLVGFFS